MPSVYHFKISLLLFFNLIFCSIAWSNCAELFSNPTFSEIRPKFFYELQRAIVGTSADHVKNLKERFGASVNDPRRKKGLFEFENDVLDLFSLAPEYRDLEEFSENWGLTRRRLKEVIGYYGIHVFGDLQSTGEPISILEHFRSVSRLHFLKFSSHPVALRAPFYRQNLTRLSVPEIALHFGITENKVYRDLSMLQYSIGASFNRIPYLQEIIRMKRRLVELGRDDQLDQVSSSVSRYELAERLIDNGMEVEVVCGVLDIGVQAFRFIQHHYGDRTRGVGWERFHKVNGVLVNEVMTLMKLSLEGMTSTEIARRLNEVFQTGNPDSPNYRTEASVFAKLREVGLTTKRKQSDPEVYLPNYGYVKVGGRLIPTAVIPYVFDHYRKSDDDIAESLGVSVSGLRNFFQRHHIVRGERRTGAEQPGFSQVSNAPAAAALARYQSQRDAIRRTIDWIQNNGGQLPLVTDFGEGPGKVQIVYRKLVGQYEYSESGHLREEQIFSNTADFWITLKKEARKEGFPVFLLYKKVKLISPKFKNSYKEEAAEIILSWMARNDFRFPRQKDFKKGSFESGMLPTDASLETVPLSYIRVFSGNKIYRKAETGDFLGVFSGADEGWLYIRKVGKKKGMPVSLVRLDRRPGNPSQMFVRAFREDMLEVVLDWMEKNEGQIPNEHSFGNNKNQIPCSYGTLIQQPRRDQGEVLIKSPLAFPRAADFWIALKVAGDRRRINVPLLKVRLSQKNRTPDFVLALQQEAVSITVDWMVLNQGREFSIPVYDNFTRDSIDLRYSRVAGTGSHRKGGEYEASAIFSTKDEFHSAIRAELLKRGLKLKNEERNNESH